VVSVAPEKQADFEKFLTEKGADFTLVGKVTDSDYVINEQTVISSEEAKSLYDNTLGEFLN